MNTFKILPIVGVIVASISGAYAAGPWSAGVGAIVTPDAYRGNQDRVYPFPVINYEGDDFYLRGFNAGYYLWKDTADQLSAVIYYSPLHFRAKDSDDHRMRQLDNRNATAMAGLSYVHNTDDYGSLRTVLAGDILDKSDGFVWDTAWLYRISADSLTLVPGIGVQWASDNQNQYYYGISKAESRRSGLASYSPDSSWSPYAELSANYKINDDWNVFATGRYIRLASEITDSPAIDKKWTGVLLTGVTYSF